MWINILELNFYRLELKKRLVNGIKNMECQRRMDLILRIQMAGAIMMDVRHQ